MPSPANDERGGRSPLMALWVDPHNSKCISSQNGYEEHIYKNGCNWAWSCWAMWVWRHVCGDMWVVACVEACVWRHVCVGAWMHVCEWGMCVLKWMGEGMCVEACVWWLCEGMCMQWWWWKCVLMCGCREVIMQGCVMIEEVGGECKV